MTRDDFFALPPAIALRVLFDALDEETARAIREAEKLTAPRCPKFDRKIFRQGGIMWASECDLECLAFWHKRASDPPSDPKYEEANKKQADELARWIAWREWYPDAAWSGERDGKRGLAQRPSSKPAVYPRTNGGGRAESPPQDNDINPDADIPW